MMNQPPIDTMARKAGNNKYRLCCLVSKRAKELEKRIPAELEASDKRAITLACEEVMNGDIVPSETEN